MLSPHRFFAFWSGIDADPCPAETVTDTGWIPSGAPAQLETKSNVTEPLETVVALIHASDTPEWPQVEQSTPSVSEFPGRMSVPVWSAI
jgi:hypothetical protein